MQPTIENLRRDVKLMIGRGCSEKEVVNELKHEYTISTIKKYYKIFKAAML